MSKVAATFSLVISVDRKSARPLHRQIYDAFRSMIVAGGLSSGQQIPSTRTLASELGISRIPILNAYGQLLAEGYFEARVGAGTFVCRSLLNRQAVPKETGNPGFRRIWLAAVSRAQRECFPASRDFLGHVTKERSI